MGARNRATRDALKDLTDEDFEAFLDDVADRGLKEACESRLWTQSATLNWIRSSEPRSAMYGLALEVRAEIAVHEGREIVDGATPETVALAKLRGSWRQWEASKWNRARYGEAVKVEHAGTLKIDAGLVVAMGDLLARAATGRVIENEAPVEALTFAPAKEVAQPTVAVPSYEPI